MKIAAITTNYSGVLFRSRLEATWAAMFDLFDWEWEYEPCDFEGWIPDFLITIDRVEYYVEVKPCVNLNDFLKHKKIRTALNSDLNILLLGSKPVKQNHFSCCPGMFGYVKDKHNQECCSSYIMLPNNFDKKQYRFYGYDHPTWEGKGIDMIAQNAIEYDWIMSIWKEARNKVMWKNPKKT